MKPLCKALWDVIAPTIHYREVRGELSQQFRNQHQASVCGLSPTEDPQGLLSSCCEGCVLKSESESITRMFLGGSPTRFKGAVAKARTGAQHGMLWEGQISQHAVVSRVLVPNPRYWSVSRARARGYLQV